MVPGDLVGDPGELFGVIEALFEGQAHREPTLHAANQMLRAPIGFRDRRLAPQVLVMVANDWFLSLILVGVMPLAALIMRRFARRTTKAAKGAMAETSALSSAIMESLDGVRVVKLENREAYEEDRVAEVVRRRQRHLTKGANARARAAPATELLMTLIVAVVFAYAGWRSTQGEMNAGAFFSFVAALTMGSQALRQLANLQTVFVPGPPLKPEDIPAFKRIQVRYFDELLQQGAADEILGPGPRELIAIAALCTRGAVDIAADHIRRRVAAA